MHIPAPYADAGIGHEQWSGGHANSTFRYYQKYSWFYEIENAKRWICRLIRPTSPQVSTFHHWDIAQGHHEELTSAPWHTHGEHRYYHYYGWAGIMQMNTHTHTHTQTRYCIPRYLHAHRGMIVSFTLHTCTILLLLLYYCMNTNHIRGSMAVTATSGNGSRMGVVIGGGTPMGIVLFMTLHLLCTPNQGWFLTLRTCVLTNVITGKLSKG